MEPISALIGLGISAVGTIMQVSASSHQNEASRRKIELEQQIEAKRRQSMELDASRKQMEVFRNHQRARAMGLEAATNQGASSGSGLQGAYGQISGQSGINLLGVNQNLELGRATFGINEQISQQKIAMGNAAQDASLAQGITSFGGSVFGASKSLNNIFSGPTNAAPVPNFGMGLPGNQTTGSLY